MRRIANIDYMDADKEKHLKQERSKRLSSSAISDITGYSVGLVNKKIRSLFEEDKLNSFLPIRRSRNRVSNYFLTEEDANKVINNFKVSRKYSKVKSERESRLISKLKNNCLRYEDFEVVTSQEIADVLDTRVITINKYICQDLNKNGVLSEDVKIHLNSKGKFEGYILNNYIALTLQKVKQNSKLVRFATIKFVRDNPGGAVVCENKGFMYYKAHEHNYF